MKYQIPKFIVFSCFLFFSPPDVKPPPKTNIRFVSSNVPEVHHIIIADAALAEQGQFPLYQSAFGMKPL